MLQYELQKYPALKLKDYGDRWGSPQSSLTMHERSNPLQRLDVVNSSGSNTTAGGDNIILLPESPGATSTKPAQQNISFGNALSFKT